jgi:hypothetical protein
MSLPNFTDPAISHRNANAVRRDVSNAEITAQDANKKVLQATRGTQGEKDFLALILSKFPATEYTIKWYGEEGKPYYNAYAIIDYEVIDNDTDKVVATFEHKLRRETRSKINWYGGHQIGLNKLEEFDKRPDIPHWICYSFEGSVGNGNNTIVYGYDKDECKSAGCFIWKLEEEFKPRNDDRNKDKDGHIKRIIPGVIYKTYKNGELKTMRIPDDENKINYDGRKFLFLEANQSGYYYKVNTTLKDSFFTNWNEYEFFD